MNILKTRSELSSGKTIYDMNLNVGYYARVSTDKDDQLNSLENQSKYFREMISENKNWNLIGEYIDEGISGTQVLKRDNFLKMINDSKEGKLDLIITKEISRFSRNVVDSIKYTEELLNNGTVVYFLSDNINTIYPDSEFRLALMSSLAQDEVRKLSERVKFGIKRMIKDGKIIGSSLTGYYRKDGKLIINENEKEIIEILFNLYSTGKYSFEYISRTLAKKGYLNKYGKEYSGTTLRKMLLNPRYKGYYTANLTYVESYKTHKKVEVPEDERIIYKDEKIPAIVSEELWDKANEVYKSKRNLKNINNLNKQEYLDNSKYTSKIICKEHNKYFTRCGSCKRRNNPVWACREYIVGGVVKCESAFIREIELDKLMTSLIEEKLSNKNEKIINNLLQNYLIVFNKNNKEKLNNLELKISELSRNREKLIELNLNSIISNDELKVRIEKIDNEIKKVHKKMKLFEFIDNEKRLNEIEKHIGNILDVKYHLNIYINLFIEKILVTKGITRHKMNFEIYFKDGEVKSLEFVN